MAIKSLMILLIVATLSRATKIFHVTPTISAAYLCPPPCHTLDHYAQNPFLFAEYTNITVIFLRGEHNLTLNLIFNCSELTLQGQKQREHTESGVVINFKSKTKVYFEKSSHLSIRDVTLRSVMIGRHLQSIELAGSTMYTALFHLLILDRVKLVTKKALSVYFNECMGTLSELEFIDTILININNTDISGFGSYLVEDHGISFISVSHVIIQESQITNYFYGMQIGSSRIDESVCGDQSQVTVTNTVFKKNRVGVYVYNDCLQRRITIKNTYFIRNKYGLFSYISYSINIWILDSIIAESKRIGLLVKNSMHVYLNTSYITENRLGIVSIGSTLTIQDTSISRNTVGVFIPTANMFKADAKDGTMFIKNCIFSFNSLAGMTLINSRGKTEIKDTSFCTNKGTPILAY